MLGEKLGELRGKVMGQRILPPEGEHPKCETSFEISGTVLGVQATVMGTYWSIVRQDGTLYGECPWQGIIMTKDGDMGTWSGAGVGRFTGEGAAVSFRGALYFQIASKKLAPLNSIAVPYEWDVDAQGAARIEIWEWT
jgi:hypothetical protein